MAEVILNDNDNTLTLSSLTNGLTASLVSGAAVGCTVKTSAGVAVSGLATGDSWPLTMVAASGTTGTYRCTLPHTLALTTGTTYYAHVTASGGTNLYGSWKLPLLSTTRTGGY